MLNKVYHKVVFYRLHSSIYIWFIRLMLLHFFLNVQPILFLRYNLSRIWIMDVIEYFARRRTIFNLFVFADTSWHRAQSESRVTLRKFFLHICLCKLFALNKAFCIVLFALCFVLGLKF